MSSKNKYSLSTSTAVIGLLALEIIFWGVCIATYQYLISNVVEFRFEHPNRLWLLSVILLLNIAWISNRIWRNKALNNFAKIETVHHIHAGYSNFRSSVKYFLFRTAFGLLIIASANPQYGENEKTVESKGIDIMIALDISRSMMAEDGLIITAD